MKNKNFLTVNGWIILLILLLGSCSENRDLSESIDVTLPPSITGMEETVVSIIRLTEEQALDLNIQTHRVERSVVTYPISVPGIVEPAPDHIAVVSTPVDGRITRIYAHEGEEVRRGAPLLDMESLEFADLVANYLESQAEKGYLLQQVERLTTLVESNISSQSSLDRATADLVRADARIRAASARLQAVGIDKYQLDQWDSEQEDERAILTMYAPIDGKINHHLINLGQAVNSNDMLLDIVDNRVVWIRGFVDPEDIPFLIIGSDVVVSQRANQNGGSGSMSVESEITTIQPGLDRENRSIMVNSLVQTVNQWPAIGQSVR
ncbi:MAG: efflux RND transporter periplasmic adaptor subunit, partial [Balneolaceae bacterium]